MREDDLTPLEQAFLAAARAGEPFAVPGFTGEAPPDADDRAHDIRAEVLEALIDGRFAGPPPGRKGLVLLGARIRGALDLSDGDLGFPLALIACRFPDRVALDRLRAPALALSDSRVDAALSASHLRIDTNLVLNAMHASAPLDLMSARIGGQLVMNKAVLDAGPDGLAFQGQGLHAAQGAFLDGLRATGTVDLNAAEIGGQLSMNEAVLDAGPDGEAFNGQGLSAAQGAFLDGLRATGTVDLNAAEIGYQLSMNEAILDAGPNGLAFRGQGLSAAQGAFLRGLRATGTVDLATAEIGGPLSMTKAVLDAGRDGLAFRGQGLSAAQGAFLKGLDATGTVQFAGARLGGSFDVPGATFRRPGGAALTLEKASVDRAWLKGLTGACEGVCDLADARIDTLYLDTPAEGWPRNLTVVAPDIRIGSLPAYTRGRRDGWIAWLDAQEPQYWAPHAYQQVAARLREGGHEDCAKAVYIAMRRKQRAEEHRAFVMAIPEPQRDHRLNGYFPDRVAEWFRRTFDAWLLDGVIGYGYRPMRAVWAMVGLILLGMLIFQQAWDARLMAPAQATIFEAIPPDATLKGQGWGAGFYDCAGRHPPESNALTRRSPAEAACLPKDYPGFIPLTYSFDLAIPLLEMRPEKHWTVNAAAPWGWLVLIWHYVQILLGSLLTGLFLAAVTGIVKKE
ncbi:MAG: hypothetical protein NXI21_01985 [Alphaproteobacteria bacterium]|nr:hypothetical protein [Alphaproteobacteria bacterium]